MPLRAAARGISPVTVNRDVAELRSTLGKAVQWGFLDVHPLARMKPRSEEHTSELQSPCNLVCRLLLEKKNAVQQSLMPPGVAPIPRFRENPSAAPRRRRRSAPAPLPSPTLIIASGRTCSAECHHVLSG